MMLCTQVRHLAVQARFQACGANANQHSRERERMKLSGRSRTVLYAALNRCAIALVAAFLVGSASHADPSSRQPATIVFVCLHGSVKSVMAAAHFNRIAKERQLPFVAVARGVDPEHILDFLEACPRRTLVPTRHSIHLPTSSSSTCNRIHLSFPARKRSRRHAWPCSILPQNRWGVGQRTRYRQPILGVHCAVHAVIRIAQAAVFAVFADCR